MSTSLQIRAYSSKENPEFQKHYKAVKFCIENKLSYPKETSEFFKGKVEGDDLEDIEEEYILKYIENGIEVELPMKSENYNEYTIKVSEIPKEVDIIIVNMG